MDRSNVTNYKQTVLRQSFVFNNGGTSNLNRSFINTALVNDSLAYGDDLRKSRIQNLPNYRKTNLGENIQFIVVFQTIQIQRLSSQIQVLRVKLKQYERQLFNSANYQVQIRQLTDRCFKLESERQLYLQEMEKLNKISQTLYHQNEMLKSRLNEMDISLKQKFQFEKSKNADLMQQIEKWKSRLQATERSKAKQLEDLRNLMQCQRKSMIDRQIRQMTIRFQNQRSSLENEIRKARQLLDNRNRQIDDYKNKHQRLQIQVMQLRNYERTIGQHQNKISLMGQQMMRLTQILKDKQDQIQNYRQKEMRLNQQIKQQTQWENQNKRLRALIETKNKQTQQWKVRCSRLEDQVVRAKQLNHYVEQLQNKLNLASTQIQRLNGVLKGKMQQIDQWKKRLSDKQIQVSKFKNLQHQIHSYETKMSNLKIQNDRINGILKSRLSQIEQWKNKYAQLQRKLNEYSYVQKDKKNIEQKFNIQIKINEQLKFNLSKLQQDINNYRRQQDRFKQIQRQNTGLNKQIQRLNNSLRNNNNEINDFKTRYSKLQSSLAEYRNIEMKVKDFEHKIINLTQQIQRLNQLINEKNQYINQLQTQQINLHSQMNHYKSYQSKIQQSESYIRKYQDQIEKIKRQLDEWQRKCKDADAKSQRLQNQMFKLAQEKEKINSMLKNKNSQFQNVRSHLQNVQLEARKVQELQSTCGQLNNHIMGLVGDIENYQRNHKQLEQQLEKEKQFTNQFAFKIIILSAEVERLSKEGAGGVKSKQFLELQQSYSRLQSKVQSKNNQIDMLNSRITNLESKISQLTLQFNRLLEQAQKSEQQSILLVKKIEQYQDYARRIHILSNQIDQLNREKTSLQQQVKMIRLRYADNINHQQKQIGIYLKFVLMASEIQTLRSRIQQREQTMEDMRKSILEPVRKI